MFTGGALPEILEHAQSVDLPGLDRDRVIELKMNGTRDEEIQDIQILELAASQVGVAFEDELLRQKLGIGGIDALE